MSNNNKELKDIDCFEDNKAHLQKINVTSYEQSISSIENISKSTEKPREHDSIMKGLLLNARFTGFLLTRIIPEMRGVTLDQFCYYTDTDPNTGKDLKQQATELGSSSTKDVRLDLVFEYNAASKLLLRINEEPQTSQHSFSEEDSSSYSLVARAVYYASLAMVTGIKSNEEYHNIRKVYSIWICFKRPIPGIREPIIGFSMQPNRKYLYVDKRPLSENKHKFDNGDLMEIIMISVPDLEIYVRNGKSTEEFSLKVLTELHTLLSSKITYNDRKQFYHDFSIIKEGFEMESPVASMEFIFEQERQLEESKRQAEEAQRQLEESKRQAEEKIKLAEEKIKQAEEAQRQILLSIIRIGASEATTIKSIKKMLGVSLEEAERLYNENKSFKTM